MVSLFRRGSTWWVTYQAGSRQVRRSLATDNRRIALDLKLQVERRLLLGEPEAPEKRSLAEYLEEYRASSQARKRPRTHATDMARLEDFVGALNCDCLGDATTADVSRFLDRKVNRDGIGTTTVLRYREILHAFFEHARRLGYVRENPVSPIPRPRLPEREPAFLRQEQVERVLEAVGRDRIHPLVATLIYAGLRREEACWLTRDDLDFAGVTPVLRVRAKTIGAESWMPKTKRDRVVPVSPKLAEILGKLKPAKGPWLFPSPTGCRWDPDNLSRHWRALMDAAGLEVNFLMLRHTFGSRLAMKGVSLLKISKLMGNSPTIAQRHYINLVPEEMAIDVEF